MKHYNMHALSVPICLYEYQLDSQKIYMVRLRLTNIDDNSPRGSYLFETKPLKLSSIECYDSSDEYNFRNGMYSLYKVMLSLL